MTKVVINRCFGGFGLSAEAECLYAKKSGFEVFHYTQTKFSHRDGVNLYELVAPKDAEMFCHTYKTKQGDSFSDDPDYSSYWYSGEIERDDPLLVEVVEELGKKASGHCASLQVVEIPDGVKWEISDYDGQEHIAEQHRTW
jgi:hypothetical protein